MQSQTASQAKAQPTELWIAACALQMNRLAEEIEFSIRAIETNALSRIEQSAGRQRELAAALAAHWLQRRETAPEGPLDVRVVKAARRLQRLNQQHAALLEHSGRFLRMLQSLYAGRGQMGNADLGGVEQRRWSIRG